MEKTVLTVPKMWADHHVLKVRGALAALEGVQEIYASSAWKQVIVNYDPATLDETTIAQVLEGAGYPVGEMPAVEERPLGAKDPAWEALGVRETRTNMRDRELSGDFRRY